MVAPLNVWHGVTVLGAGTWSSVTWETVAMELICERTSPGVPVPAPMNRHAPDARRVLHGERRTFRQRHASPAFRKSALRRGTSPSARSDAIDLRLHERGDDA